MLGIVHFFSDTKSMDCKICGRRAITGDGLCLTCFRAGYGDLLVDGVEEADTSDVAEDADLVEWDEPVDSDSVAYDAVFD